MSILSIEKRLVKPMMGYHNFESPVPGETTYGEVLASALMEGLIRVVQFGAGVSYRKIANIEFPNRDVERLWFNAENEALGKVGDHRKFIYRLRPDGQGDVDLLFSDMNLFQKLEPGMSGIIIGEIARNSVAQ